MGKVFKDLYDSSNVSMPTVLMANEWIGSRNCSRHSHGWEAGIELKCKMLVALITTIGFVGSTLSCEVAELAGPGCGRSVEITLATKDKKNTHKGPKHLLGVSLFISSIYIYIYIYIFTLKEEEEEEKETKQKKKEKP